MKHEKEAQGSWTATDCAGEAPTVFTHKWPSALQYDNLCPEALNVIVPQMKEQHFTTHLPPPFPEHRGLCAVNNVIDSLPCSRMLFVVTCLCTSMNC